MTSVSSYSKAHQVASIIGKLVFHILTLGIPLLIHYLVCHSCDHKSTRKISRTKQQKSDAYTDKQITKRNTTALPHHQKSSETTKKPIDNSSIIPIPKTVDNPSPTSTAELSKPADDHLTLSTKTLWRTKYHIPERPHPLDPGKKQTYFPIDPVSEIRQYKQIIQPSSMEEKDQSFEEMSADFALISSSTTSKPSILKTKTSSAYSIDLNTLISSSSKIAPLISSPYSIQNYFYSKNPAYGTSTPILQKQIQYLDKHFASCEIYPEQQSSFIAVAISWLINLTTKAFQGETRAYTDAIQSILSRTEFINSSTQAEKSSHQAVSVVRRISALHSFKEICNDVIFSPKKIDLVASYFKLLSSFFYTQKVLLKNPIQTWLQASETISKRIFLRLQNNPLCEPIFNHHVLLAKTLSDTKTLTIFKASLTHALTLSVNWHLLISKFPFLQLFFNEADKKLFKTNHTTFYNQALQNIHFHPLFQIIYEESVDHSNNPSALFFFLKKFISFAQKSHSAPLLEFLKTYEDHCNQLLSETIDEKWISLLPCNQKEVSLLRQFLINHDVTQRLYLKIQNQWRRLPGEFKKIFNPFFSNYSKGINNCTENCIQYSLPKSFSQAFYTTTLPFVYIPEKKTTVNLRSYTQFTNTALLSQLHPSNKMLCYLRNDPQVIKTIPALKEWLHLATALEKYALASYINLDDEITQQTILKLQKPINQSFIISLEETHKLHNQKPISTQGQRIHFFLGKHFKTTCRFASLIKFFVGISEEIDAYIEKSALQITNVLENALVELSNTPLHRKKFKLFVDEMHLLFSNACHITALKSHPLNKKFLFFLFLNNSSIDLKTYPKQSALNIFMDWFIQAYHQACEKVTWDNDQISMVLRFVEKIRYEQTTTLCPLISLPFIQQNIYNIVEHSPLLLQELEALLQEYDLIPEDLDNALLLQCFSSDVNKISLCQSSLNLSEQLHPELYRLINLYNGFLDESLPSIPSLEKVYLLHIDGQYLPLIPKRLLSDFSNL